MMMYDCLANKTSSIDSQLWISSLCPGKTEQTTEATTTDFSTTEATTVDMETTAPTTEAPEFTTTQSVTSLETTTTGTFHISLISFLRT